MTHSAPMPDSDGTFNEWRPSERACSNCGSTKVSFRIWESNDGAYEDAQYRCPDCGDTWWVDGIDS